MSVEYKQRAIGIDWGGEPDRIYSGSGAYRTTKDGCFDNDDQIISWYRSYRASASSLLTVPSYYGTFVGTELLSGVKGRRNTYNPCYHVRIGARNLPHCAVRISGSYPDMYHVEYFYRRAFPTATCPTISEVENFHRTVSDTTFARARALHTMQPRFQGKVDLLNFVFELKDFKDIVKLANSKYFANFLDLMQGYRSLTSRRGLRSPEPTGVSANAWLAYNLAYAPFVRDLFQIIKQAQETVTELQNQFALDGINLQDSHYSEDLGVVDELGPPGTRNSWWLQSGTYSCSKYTATFGYTYDYRVVGTIPLYCKYWGLGGSFESFWNAVPFTFVADYVIQIGKSIRAMERDPHVNITSSWLGESIKTTKTRGVHTAVGTSRNFGIYFGGDKVFRNRKAEGRLLAGFQASIYNRAFVGHNPIAGLYVPRVKLPSGKQSITLAALARTLFLP